MNRLPQRFIAAAFLLLIAVIAGVLFASCSTATGGGTVSEKVSSQLAAQVGLRTAQIDHPTQDRLDTMKAMGMNVDNLATQRIFIHLAAQLTPGQVDELKSIGITLYEDSWIPPVGNNPTGFLLADMPVDKLADLTAKAYVISVDTAERQLQPQNTFQPQ